MSDIRPHFGYETGGKAIKLIGSTIVSSSSLACYFDETRADCVMPKLKQGNYTIKVSLNSVGAIDTSLQYQLRLRMTRVVGTSFQRDSAL